MSCSIHDAVVIDETHVLCTRCRTAGTRTVKGKSVQYDWDANVDIETHLRLVQRAVEMGALSEPVGEEGPEPVGGEGQ